MQHFSTSNLALAIADDMVAQRFGHGRSIHTFAAYLDYIDARATAHLNPASARRVIGSAGAQRRKARLTLENGTSVILALPMNDAHTGKTVWAEIELGTWLNLIEMGADGAWFYLHKGKDRRTGQVRTNAPMRSTTTNKNTTVARLIVNAKAGQQARTLDGNPMNLRSGNVYLNGNTDTCEGRVGRAKTDSAALLKGQLALRQKLAGSGFGFDGGEAQ
ncbi:hypothetical protein [Pseudotabrizicola alkalilacus]|uniref:Uncharacterized protein n=1 Tax=Pseudotabrizicola alkalilacus TaxID=2305252 RepID=A0A411Z3U4_9RHOB|nr:hypothetical protein [Pseudotabrizicola alkalilacus]RGP37731.1 hypothetical protein D1012_07400 [Pseudotabrizicola alkalilacus]